MAEPIELLPEVDRLVLAPLYAGIPPLVGDTLVAWLGKVTGFQSDNVARLVLDLQAELAERRREVARLIAENVDLKRALDRDPRWEAEKEDAQAEMDAQRDPEDDGA